MLLICKRYKMNIVYISNSFFLHLFPVPVSVIRSYTYHWNFTENAVTAFKYGGDESHQQLLLLHKE